MNREQRRNVQKTMKSMKNKDFWAEMNIIHTKAYNLAESHYSEAMDIVLQPKQKAAVIAKANEIRELWDGLNTITVDDAKLVDESQVYGNDCPRGGCDV